MRSGGARIDERREGPLNGKKPRVQQVQQEQREQEAELGRQSTQSFASMVPRKFSRDSIYDTCGILPEKFDELKTQIDVDVQQVTTFEELDACFGGYNSYPVGGGQFAVQHSANDVFRQLFRNIPISVLLQFKQFAPFFQGLQGLQGLQGTETITELKITDARLKASLNLFIDKLSFTAARDCLRSALFFTEAKKLGPGAFYPKEEHTRTAVTLPELIHDYKGDTDGDDILKDSVQDKHSIHYFTVKAVSTTAESRLPRRIYSAILETNTELEEKKAELEEKKADDDEDLEEDISSLEEDISDLKEKLITLQQAHAYLAVNLAGKHYLVQFIEHYPFKVTELLPVYTGTNGVKTDPEIIAATAALVGTDNLSISLILSCTPDVNIAMNFTADGGDIFCFFMTAGMSCMYIDIATRDVNEREFLLNAGVIFKKIGIQSLPDGKKIHYFEVKYFRTMTKPEIEAKYLQLKEAWSQQLSAHVATGKVVANGPILSQQSQSQPLIYDDDDDVGGKKRNTRNRNRKLKGKKSKKRITRKLKTRNRKLKGRKSKKHIRKTYKK